MRVREAERGQALVETVLFLPVALVVLFAIVYFARFGVLDERTQTALRYGAQVSYESSVRYSAADIYATVATTGSPVCPSNAVSDMTGIVNGTGPSASARAFWKPDVPATATCTVTTANFGGASWSSYHYVTVTHQSVAATMNVPSSLASLLGGTGTVSGSLGYAHADPPSMIIWCVSNVATAVSTALNVSYTGSSC